MVSHRLLVQLLGAAVFFMSASGSSSRHGKKCPPFNKPGNITLHQYQLYPQTAAWDTNRCVAYFCALFNGSIAEYDPYLDKFTVINFAGITHALDQHASGIDYNPATGLLHIVIDSQRPFLTEGADVGGDNWLVRYDPAKRKEHWRANLTATTNGLWGGFQDVAVDSRGNSYVIGTYPKSVLKVSPKGKVSVWYPPQTTNTKVRGYTGAVSLNGDTMIVVDNEGVPESELVGDSNIYRFDLTKPSGVPVKIPRFPPTQWGPGDKIQFPPMYENKVALIADDYRGTIVLRSEDGKWTKAEHLGLIPNDYPVFFSRITPSTVQLGPKKQYLIGNNFPGPIVPGTTGGNHSDFPLFDITKEVENLLKGKP
ncbi:TRI14-like protein [Naviculisporaceae sp. PSN 640]